MGIGPYESKIEFLHVLLSLISYVFSFLSCLIVFQFILELEEDKGTWNNFDWEYKFGYLSISVVSMSLALLLFTFAMFLSVRAAWFLVPLAVLFFTLRMVNYFRYGIVHPSFGVDFLEEE